MTEKFLFTFAEVTRLAEITESMVRKLVRSGQLEAVEVKP
jgi:hypothetical protein